MLLREYSESTQKWSVDAILFRWLRRCQDLQDKLHWHVRNFYIMRCDQPLLSALLPNSLLPPTTQTQTREYAVAAYQGGGAKIRVTERSGGQAESVLISAPAVSVVAALGSLRFSLGILINMC
jgi:hypothetical protein